MCLDGCWKKTLMYIMAPVFMDILDCSYTRKTSFLSILETCRYYFHSQADSRLWREQNTWGLSLLYLYLIRVKWRDCDWKICEISCARKNRHSAICYCTRLKHHRGPDKYVALVELRYRQEWGHCKWVVLDDSKNAFDLIDHHIQVP